MISRRTRSCGVLKQHSNRANKRYAHSIILLDSSCTLAVVIELQSSSIPLMLLTGYASWEHAQTQ